MALSSDHPQTPDSNRSVSLSVVLNTSIQTDCYMKLIQIDYNMVTVGMDSSS